LTRRVGSLPIDTDTSRDSSETEGHGPIYDPRFHHCRLETCFYIGVGQVITEIECSACGRIWHLTKRTKESEDGETETFWYWRPDPELAVVKEQRRRAAIEKRMREAAKRGKLAARSARGPKTAV
jgi:hypothetical protein